jgi:glutamate racemase
VAARESAMIFGPLSGLVKRCSEAVQLRLPGPGRGATGARMHPSAPLLVFDSGVGGLSVLEGIRTLLPQAPIVYAADSAGFPYGTRKAAEIEARVPALLGRLVERYDPRLIVIACNTASTIALDAVRAALDLPIVGTVPAIKPAAALSRTRSIGVLGTPATVVQPYVDRLAADFAADCTVLRHGSAELVELAEAKLRGETGELSAYCRILEGLLGKAGGEAIDTIVLACTHFPLVQPELEAAAPRPIAFVDGNAGIARRTAWLMRDEGWPETAGEGIALFTGPAPEAETFRLGLARFGLCRIETLQR